MQREATETSHEDAHVEGGVQVRASYGPAAEVTANAGFALNSSKDEATREAQNYARDVTQRSVARIQERVREQRTVRTLAEVEETIKHGVDNSKGNGHVVGIYRWVDKVYEAQVFNYGKRMLLEFNVPEPAAFFLNALKSRTPEGIAAEKPLPPMVSNDAQGNPLPKARPLAPDDITIGNYLGWVQKYRVTGVTPPPKTYEVVTTTIEEGVTEEGKEDEKKAKKRKTVFKTAKDLKTPAGYKAIKYHLISLADNGAREHMLLAWTVGDRSDHHAGDASQNPPKHAPWGFGHADNLGTVLEPPGQPGKAAVEGTLPVALYYHDVWGFAVTLQVLCERTEEKLREWQLKTYEQIMLAYQELKSRYDEEIAAAAVRQGIGVAGRNPEANREIEKEELKKATISMLRGGRFEEFDAVYQEDPDGDDPVKKYPEIDVEQAQQEGRLIQFFEQAFEWPQITYVFYPYFWGRKKLWADRSQLDDPADPIFSQFLRAGAARVAVPVRRGYEDLVNAYLATDQVWGGGDAPAVGAPLYVSLAQEIRELTDAGAADAKPEGKSWEVSLPTTLVILNEEAKKLPVFEQ